MSVLRLYPAPVQERSLVGTYLDMRLHRQAGEGGMLIYANYIASLDGRISLADAHGRQQVPKELANARDWRLYQELAAQSDIMLTSARYFRQLAEGCAQDLLPVGTAPEYADLSDWRQREGLPAQPDVAIVSASLDIPQAALEKVGDRRVLVLTGECADDAKLAALEACGVEVISAGRERVEGRLLKRRLVANGYHSACMIAGPAVHVTLLRSGVLDELFLTTRHMLLGGDDFSSIAQGGMNAPVEFELNSLFHDVTGGQTFARYRVSRSPEGV